MYLTKYFYGSSVLKMISINRFIDTVNIKSDYCPGYMFIDIINIEKQDTIAPGTTKSKSGKISKYCRVYSISPRFIFAPFALLHEGEFKHGLIELNTVRVLILA